MTTKQQVFNCLSGRWQLHRSYISFLADYPSGAAKGTAQFEQRCSTQGLHIICLELIVYLDGALEYLYSEETEFTPQNNQQSFKGKSFVKFLYIVLMF